MSRSSLCIACGLPDQIDVHLNIIELVDSISRDEPDSPLTQYITNAGISRARYIITHFKHHHRVLRLYINQHSYAVDLTSLISLAIIIEHITSCHVTGNVYSLVYSGSQTPTTVVLDS